MLVFMSMCLYVCLVCIKNPYTKNLYNTLTHHTATTADGTGVKYNDNVNVAMAVAMDGGLITPVLKNADVTDIYTMSRQWADLVKRARSKQLAPDEYNSGTFAVSNLGMFGVDSFDAILPPGVCVCVRGGAKGGWGCARGRGGKEW